MFSAFKRSVHAVLFSPIDDSRSKYLVYDHDLLSNDTVNAVNKYSKAGDFHFKEKDLFPPKLKTLGGRTFSAASFVLPPFTVKSEVGKYEGFEVHF